MLLFYCLFLKQNLFEVKKVLIITYHWPPSGGITVLRCLKFAKYLREFGWEPVIFTAKNPSYQYLDFNNEKDIPHNIEIHQVPIFEPINLFKKISGRNKNTPIQNITSNSGKKKSIIDKFAMWVRGNFFIPDARYKWIKPSVKYLDKYLKENKIDAILSDGPPHTNTVIGLKIAQKHNIPWLADFQDPWTQVDYYSKLYIGKKADQKHKRLEQEVFQTASKITIASPTWKKDLESIGAKNVDVIYYGYDESDFSNYIIKTNKDIIIFHGGLLGEDRNPELFFKVLNHLIEKHAEIKSKLKIIFAGEVDISVKTSIEMNGLKPYTSYIGMISRAEVYDYYAKSSLLLLPINKAENANGRIPGKLFELLRSEKPIIAFGPKNGDVAAILKQTESGELFEYEDENDIYAYLTKVLVNSEFSTIKNQDNIKQYSNYFLTSKIAFYLDEISK
jgi:hypothetical protein